MQDSWFGAWFGVGEVVFHLPSARTGFKSPVPTKSKPPIRGCLINDNPHSHSSPLIENSVINLAMKGESKGSPGPCGKPKPKQYTKTTHAEQERKPLGQQAFRGKRPGQGDFSKQHTCVLVPGMQRTEEGTCIQAPLLCF